MTCPDCGGPMKPLLVGMYCVNECDLKKPDNDLGDWREITKPMHRQVYGFDFVLDDESDP